MSEVFQQSFDLVNDGAVSSEASILACDFFHQHPAIELDFKVTDLSCREVVQSFPKRPGLSHFGRTAAVQIAHTSRDQMTISPSPNETDSYSWGIIYNCSITIHTNATTSRGYPFYLIIISISFMDCCRNRLCMAIWVGREDPVQELLFIHTRELILLPVSILPYGP
uniref:Uncharacterized protein n=1 Tax=Cannabis sativa TaxID=3483 RepID=A0A803PRV6_CANSA